MARPIEGRGFAFVPRDLVAQPKAFGLAPGLLEPAHGVDGTGERYRAAMVQHLMAAAVRAVLLRTSGISPTRFVARFSERGLGADRVRRVFRGETMAQLTDVLFWTGHFPEVAAAISVDIAPWFAVSTTPEADVEQVEVSVPTPAPSRVLTLEERRLEALRARVEALRSEAPAPLVRRTPQHPFA